MQNNNHTYKISRSQSMYAYEIAGRSNFLNTQKTNKKPGVCL